MASPRVVTLDIETSPLIAYCWGTWDQNIGLDMVKEEWSILSFSAKWMNDKKVIFKHTGGRGAAKVRDDKQLLKDLWAILDEADIVVTQNGKAFDIKKINARLIMHGFKPYSPIKVVDTKIIAKKVAAFTSNRLAWLSEKLNKTAQKDKHKQFPGFELWVECQKDNPKAWAEMRKYNSIDVLATEELYLRLRPWTTGHPNMAIYYDIATVACPKCASKNVQKRGRSFSQTGEYHRYRCNDCGGWSRSRFVMNTADKRKAMLSN